MKTLLRSCLVLLAAGALSLAGCMIGETTHTLYLESDGTLTWVVEESQMRSAEDEAPDRLEEEREWLDARRAESHPQAEALWEIGARTVETRVVRDRRPFHVLTRATFADPGDAVRRLLESSGVVADVDVSRTSRGGAIAVRIDVEATEAAEELRDDEDDTPLARLSGDDFVLMVADGEFVASVGFDVENDLARFDDEALEDALERDPRFLRLFLEWEQRR